MATLHIRWATVTFKRRQYSQTGVPALTMQAVHVVEPAPPPGETPIEWMLLTSEPVHSLEDATAVVDHYRARWLIEEVLQSPEDGLCLRETPTHARHRPGPRPCGVCADGLATVAFAPSRPCPRVNARRPSVRRGPSAALAEARSRSRRSGLASTAGPTLLAPSGRELFFVGPPDTRRVISADDDGASEAGSSSAPRPHRGRSLTSTAGRFRSHPASRGPTTSRPIQSGSTLCKRVPPRPRRPLRMST